MKKTFLMLAVMGIAFAANAQSDTDKSRKQGERKSPDVVNSQNSPHIVNSNQSMGYNSSKKRENDPSTKTTSK